MPELPEVEILKLGLQKYIVGKTIETVDVKNKRIFSGDPKNIIGAKVVKVERFGKGLVIEFNNGYSLAIHIKLTGQLIYRNHESGIKNQEGRLEVPNKFTHVIFKFKSQNSKVNPQGNKRSSRLLGGSRMDSPQVDAREQPALYYNDIRQFGWIKVIKTENIHDLPFFKNLGPDILNNVTIEQFSNTLEKSKSAVKVLLMDQTVFSGIGNIYANDALWLAKINPKRPANSLSSAEQNRLYESILTVLKKGLQEGGASELTFVNILGEKGNYQEHTLVYGKTGKPCKRCGTKIIRKTLGGRGTFICPKCQM